MKDTRLMKSFKYGVAGGILGSFVRSPGLGMAIGVAYANKDKIMEFEKQVDKSFNIKGIRGGN
jgi:hypothetical protein